MLRSIGGRSFTTSSPMRISPEVISSRPATMRKVVVFPQPDGPTSTRNSLSRISRSTSFTAWKPLSYFLFSRRMETLAIEPCSLTLHRPGEAGHVVLDEERMDQCDRHRAEQRAGHELAPEEDVAADQLGHDAHRDGLLVRRGHEDQRVDELVPRQGEGEDTRRQDAGYRHRQDD